MCLLPVETKLSNQYAMIVWNVVGTLYHSFHAWSSVCFFNIHFGGHLFVGYSIGFCSIPKIICLFDSGDHLSIWFWRSFVCLNLKRSTVCLNFEVNHLSDSGGQLSVWFLRSSVDRFGRSPVFWFRKSSGCLILEVTCFLDGRGHRYLCARGHLSPWLWMAVL
jgi:hypothetical protein